MVGNKDDKPLLAFYTFNFVVQAKTFEEAKSIIRNTLDIRVSRKPFVIGDVLKSVVAALLPSRN